jgi:hypothetical protein
LDGFVSSAPTRWSYRIENCEQIEIEIEIEIQMQKDAGEGRQKSDA